jgi:hypothetical protein
MKSFTIFGYENSRYFVPANNPYGHYVWFPTRHLRDDAVAQLEAHAAEQGLSDPTFRRVSRRIRTELQRDWYERLCERRLLLANGIDGRRDSPSHSWEDREEAAS